MYESYVLTLFYKIYHKLYSWYANSVLRKVELSFKNTFKKLATSSKVVSFFTNDRSLMKDSFLYRAYSSAIKAIDKTTQNTRSMVERYRTDSFVYGSLYSLFRDKRETIKAIAIFFLFFSVPAFLMKVTRVGFETEAIILLSVAICSLLLLLASTGISYAVEKSAVVNFTKSLFTIDEEDNSWR